MSARRRRRNFQNSTVYVEIIQSPCKKRDFPPSFLSPPFSPPLFFSSPLPLLLFIFFTFEKIPLLSFSAFLARDFFRRSQDVVVMRCSVSFDKIFSSLVPHNCTMAEFYQILLITKIVEQAFKIRARYFSFNKIFTSRVPHNGGFSNFLIVKNVSNKPLGLGLETPPQLPSQLSLRLSTKAGFLS